MRRLVAALIPLLLMLVAVRVLVAQQAVPAKIPQQAFAAQLKAKQWRQDAILVMVQVNDYSGAGKFTIQFSFYSPSNQMGLWVIENEPGGSIVSEAGVVNWGTEAIPSLFLDLPAAVQRARAQGMQGKVDHALLRVTSSGLTWEVAPVSDPNLRTYAINASLGASSAATERDSLIVPGQRIGPVSLGMTMADVLKALGLQSEKCSTSRINGIDLGLTYCNFREFGLGINFEADDPGVQPANRKANRITADIEEGGASRKYVTDRGIRIGNSSQDVLRAYGNEVVKQKDGGDADSDLIYAKLGITFYLGGSDENDKRLHNTMVGKIEVVQPKP